MTPQPRAAHWREYAMEAWGLGTFMLSACVCGTLLWHPQSPLAHWFGAAWTRRAAMGGLMAATLLTIVYSPWGRRSGAQLNPAFTLTFLRLGKIAPRDAVAYVAAQFVGGAAGVGVARLLVGPPLGHAAVQYVVTQPGQPGVAVAFAAELAISALQMLLVLTVAGSARWRSYTGVCAAAALASYITIESPLSGTSMNPARSVASALVAGSWASIWLYFAAPMLGMTLAATLYARLAASDRVPCGKMVHAEPCLFCEHVARRAQPAQAA